MAAYGRSTTGNSFWMRSHRRLSAASIAIEGYAREMRAAPVSSSPRRWPLAPALWRRRIGEAQHAAFICGSRTAPRATRSRPGKPSPNADAANLADVHPTVEEVRRAVIDGRPGMPKGLVGGDDVDSVAAYVVAEDER